MTPLDTELFNEFKRLDKLLREARYTERGVSDYIDEMKTVSYATSCSVLGWKNDLDHLWRCRHIRNKLAHDYVPDGINLSRAEDVEFLKDFYTRVMNGDDPLARLRKLRLAQKRPTEQSGSTLRQWPASYNNREPRQSTRRRSSSGCLTAVLGVLFLLLVPCAIPFVAAIMLMILL